MIGVSILGRIGAMLRSELSARLHQRRGTANSEAGRPVGGDSRSPPAPAAPPSSGRAQDPELARYYANLELVYGADVGAVREARRRMLKRYHPDLHSTDPEKRRIATELAKGLNRAHDEIVRRLGPK